MNLAAGIVGAVVGVLASPLADRIATNAPLHDPLLRRVPRSPRLPLITFGLALLGGACGLVFGFTLDAAAATLLCWVLVVITRTDLEHRLIPDKIVLPSAAVLVALRTFDDPSIEWILCALGAGLALFLVVLVHPRGLGMGDVKLSALLGAALGVPVLVAFFVGFFLAFLPALALFVRHGRDVRKLAMPLGPFLALGGIVALFWGDAILDWYKTLGTA